MTAAASRDATSRDAASPAPASRREVAAWQIGGGVVVFLVGSFLHFLYELSGFHPIGAVIGSVNESTWEHLKLFFWPGLAMGAIEHAYLRERVSNIWPAVAARLWLTAASVAVAFYAYVGVVLPIDGTGTLAGTIATALVGVVVGQVASYRLMRAPRWSAAGTRLSIALILALLAAFVVFTFAPPRLFLFEDFLGYRYAGQYGILDDYTKYLVFK